MGTGEFKRRLTAILSADVQGYSRLMGEDEESTVRTLTAYQELMSVLIQRHQGRVVDTPGDNLLAEFGSVMDAVRSAVEIQEEIRIRNAELPDNRKMQFRIGINLGDVIEEGDRIYGDGINVAARVEGLAARGGICISGTVYDAIRNKLSVSYEFQGEHIVKNVKEPVRIYRIRIESEVATSIVKEKKARLRTWQWAALSVMAIFILGAVAYIVVDKFYLDRRAAETPHTPFVFDFEEAPKTIAILRFDDFSPEKDQEYFVNGISEEILNTIVQIPDLNVSGRTSSFSFKDSNKTTQEIGEILGVENILEGSVRKAGNILRITAQLLRAKDGFHLWSNSYDRELKDVADILLIQEEIATAVANELKATLGIGGTFKQLGGTNNLEAYELYLVALGQSDDLATKAPINEKEWSYVVESIDAAITLDPEYALAWALKAKTHIFLSIFGPSSLAATEHDAAQTAALKAVELQPDMSGGYMALGNIKRSRCELIEAGYAFREAYELVSEPLSGNEFTIGHFYNIVGNFKKANELFEEMRQNDPLHKEVRCNYLLSLGFLGNIQQAEKEYELGRARFGDQWSFGNLYITVLRLGSSNVINRDEIVYSDPIFDMVKGYLDSPEEGLKELSRFYANEANLSSVDFGNISLWAAYFGDPEFAMDAIKKGVNIDATGIFTIWFPVMREVRQLPRFKEFVREIGLVDYWNEFGWPDICHPFDNGDFECN